MAASTLELLKELTEVNGIPGYEAQVRAVVRKHLEPLGELSSPLVGDRDFVSERMQIRMRVAQLHLNTIQGEVERARSLMEAGVIDERELQSRNLAEREAALQLNGLAKRLEVRQAYLDSDISAVEAELQILDVLFP